MRTYHLEAWMRMVMGLVQRIMASIDNGDIKL